MRLVVAGGLFLRSLGLAVAGDANAPAPASAEEASLQGYGAAAPRCAEWSDGCASCRRDAGAVHCSTPGIACQPAAIVCRSESGK